MCDQVMPFYQPSCSNNNFQTCNNNNNCGGQYNNCGGQYNNCGGQFNCGGQPSPMLYSGADLESIPQCAPRSPPANPKCITIQQPPHLICKKRVLFVNKTVNEPMVVNRCKPVQIPKIVQHTKVIRVPKLTWETQLIREPRIIYYQSMEPDPYVACCPREISEPREVCQMMLCQPKPQYIDVPPPTDYCCYPTGPTNYQTNGMCPNNAIPQNYAMMQSNMCCRPFPSQLSQCNNNNNNNRQNSNSLFGSKSSGSGSYSQSSSNPSNTHSSLHPQKTSLQLHTLSRSNVSGGTGAPQQSQVLSHNGSGSIRTAQISQGARQYSHTVRSQNSGSRR